MAVLIFANGEMEGGDWLRPHLAQATALIAADGGAYHLLNAGVRPQLIIGDLDSLDPATQAELTQAGVTIWPHLRDKDETDLELALLHAAATYPDEPIRVLGAFGGRVDHMVANLLLLAHPELRGRDIQLLDQQQRAWLIEEQATIQGEPGDTLSLIPFGGDVLVRRTTGLKWALHNDWLRFGPARGISNILTSPLVQIQVAGGVLLAVYRAAK